MRQRESEFAGLGLRIVVVTFEARERAEEYVREVGLAWPLLIDRQRVLYGAYGMARGRRWAIWGPATWWAYARLIGRGHRLRRPTGDVNQLGGDVLVDPMAANLRVGYLVAPPDLVQALTDQKLLGALTTPEFGERVVARVLSESHYTRHCAGLRANLAGARQTALARLRKLGARVFAEDAQGMFLWADLGTDTNRLATRLFDAGYLAAPGSLFCPSQLPSTWMRFNVASSQNPAMWRALQSARP